jgi:peptidoglycan/LPS O-acetylase OafA/YrhL
MKTTAIKALNPYEIPARRFYLPELDGLRFLAFSAVFAHHFCLALGSTSIVPWAGAFGVDLFFTLSAYLITELLLRERQKFGRVDIRSFYIRRILRIWPLYFAFLSLCSFFLLFYPNWFEFPWPYFASFFIFLGNFSLCIWKNPSLRSLAIAPLWSVSVEEQFYLTWPLVVSRLERKGICKAAICLWTFSILSRSLMVKFGFSNNAIAFSTMTRLDPIACGVLVSAMLNGSTQPVLYLRRSILFVTSVCLWMLAATLLHYRDQPSAIWTNIGYVIVAVGCALFLYSTIGVDSWLRQKWVRYLGRISYGLYVYHGVSIELVFYSLSGHPLWMRWYLSLFISFGVTSLLAIISYKWLETPFLRLKSRFQYIPSAEGSEDETKPIER